MPPTKISGIILLHVHTEIMYNIDIGEKTEENRETFVLKLFDYMIMLYGNGKFHAGVVCMRYNNCIYIRIYKYIFAREKRLAEWEDESAVK